ncbi:hypothetical protein Tco_1553786, partial [Tanacetum coccineum]
GTDNGQKDTIKPKKDKIRAREGKEHEKPRPSNNSSDITDITQRIYNLECDMQKLQENIHAIQVGYKIVKEVCLAKEHSLKEDDKLYRLKHVEWCWVEAWLQGSISNPD